MGRELTPEEIDRLVQQISNEDPRHLVRRLLRGDSLWVLDSDPQSYLDGTGLAQESSAAYDGALDRAEEFARRVAYLSAHDLKQYRKALALLKTGRGVLSLAQVGDMNLSGMGVFEALLMQSWAIRYDNPMEMCHLSLLAVQLAERLSPDEYKPRVMADIRARAWGELANAYRVADRFREAEKAFGTAFSFAEEGTGDRDLRMRLLDLESSYLGTVREFDLALNRLALLTGLYLEDGDSHLAGRALVTKALYLFYQGDAEKALEENAKAIRLIDAQREPGLLLVAVFDHLLFLTDCQRFSEAKKLLFINRPRLSQIGRVATLKLRWIEGRINAGLEHLESAEIAFRETSRQFHELGMSFHAGIASLDLALTLIKQERIEEAAEEAIAAATLFKAFAIHREILGSVLIIEEAVKANRLTLDLLQRTAQYLAKKGIHFGLR